MRMKSTGIWPLELVGNITELKRVDNWLNMRLRTTTPAGWDFTAALTHEDLRTMFKLLFRPSNLIYLVLGFLRPVPSEPPQEY